MRGMVGYLPSVPYCLPSCYSQSIRGGDFGSSKSMVRGLRALMRSKSYYLRAGSSTREEPA